MNRYWFATIAILALLGASISIHARVAEIWYLTLDPADVVLSTASSPQQVISFDPADDSTATENSLTDPPVEIDGLERVDDTTFYFSVDTHVELDGLVIAPGDIVFSDGGSLSLAFDSGTEGLPDGINVDAVALDGNDDLVFSTDTHVDLGGTVFEDADLIRFDGSGFGMVFDASVAGFPDKTDIDAATGFSEGRLAVSTKTGGMVESSSYGHGTLLLVDNTDEFLNVEFSATDDAGTAADIVSLSAEPIGDVIFMDRFETS